ncbi:MAG: alpha/beta hydrolase [Lacibacter sp.]
MKRLITISISFLLSIAIHAQENCLPQYDLPVKTIQLSSGKLAYIEKGKGKTILFIHGLGGNSSHWAKSVKELSSTNTCIAIDLPGYGWSDKQVDTKGKDQLQFYADVIAEFLQKKKIKKVILAGHSMGGQIAIITSLQNKKVKKLILAAPAGLETFTEKEAQLLLASTPPSFFEKQDESVIRNNFKLNFYQQPADTEQLILDRLKMKQCSDFILYCTTVSNGVKGMLAHPVKDSLKNISIPVLILYGANDALIPNRYLHPGLTTESIVKESAAFIKNCKVEFVPKAGHMFQFEKSSEVNNIIQQFLH